jgi:hypothetical protein
MTEEKECLCEDETRAQQHTICAWIFSFTLFSSIWTFLSESSRLGALYSLKWDKTWVMKSLAILSWSRLINSKIKCLTPAFLNSCARACRMVGCRRWGGASTIEIWGEGENRSIAECRISWYLSSGWHNTTSHEFWDKPARRYNVLRCWILQPQGNGGSVSPCLHWIKNLWRLHFLYSLLGHSFSTTFRP